MTAAQMRQVDRVRLIMRLRGWQTLEEIKANVRAMFGTLDTEAAISARLRDLGAVLPIRKRKREGTRNLWEYELELTPRVVACRALMRSAPIDVAQEWAASTPMDRAGQIDLFGNTTRSEP